MKPYLVVRCACGRGLVLELGYGKRVGYTGMGPARTLADLFGHFHKGDACEVSEEVRELTPYEATHQTAAPAPVVEGTERGDAGQGEMKA